VVRFRGKERADGQATIPPSARPDVSQIKRKLGMDNETDAVPPGKIRGNDGTDRETELHHALGIHVFEKADLE
jgi:hypothetical protein